MQFTKHTPTSTTDLGTEAKFDLVSGGWYTCGKIVYVNAKIKCTTAGIIGRPFSVPHPLVDESITYDNYALPIGLYKSNGTKTTAWILGSGVIYPQSINVSVDDIFFIHGWYLAR